MLFFHHGLLFYGRFLQLRSMKGKVSVKVSNWNISWWGMWCKKLSKEMEGLKHWWQMELDQCQVIFFSLRCLKFMKKTFSLCCLWFLLEFFVKWQAFAPVVRYSNAKSENRDSFIMQNTKFLFIASHNLQDTCLEH